MQSTLFMQITTTCMLIKQYIIPFAGIYIELLPGAAPHAGAEAMSNRLVPSMYCNIKVRLTEDTLCYCGVPISHSGVRCPRKRQGTDSRAI